MSQDRNIEDEQSWISVPMCALDHARDARKHYGQRARDPVHPDELGAVAVVDPMVCGRAGCFEVCCQRRAFFKIHDSDFCEVRQLTPLYAAGAQAAHAPAKAQLVAPTRRRSVVADDAGPLFARGRK